MRKFRVLQVAPLIQVAGTELSTFILVKELKRRGHEVSIYSNDGPLTKEFKSHGIQVILGNSYSRKESAWEILKTIFELKKCIEKNRIEILHVQTASSIPLAFLANKLSRWKAKIIWHCRGLNPRNYNLVSRIAAFATDFIITNCNSEKSKIETHGVPRYKIKTIYNSPPAVEIPRIPVHKDEELLKELKINDSTAVIASISRLEVDRGIQYYLEAASKLINNYKFTNVRFLVVGDGPLKNNLLEKAGRLGISNYVIFLGVRRDIGRIYSIIDILVNPNLLGLGTDNINIEAMAFCKPVVASEVGGIPEIVIDGENGFLIAPRNSESIAEKVFQLLNSEELRKRMGDLGRKRVEKYFTRERLGDEIEKVYEMLRKNEIS